MRIAAVILAAGFGTRLAPLTDHTPKPLIRVGDRPVIDHLLNRLREIDALAEVVIVVNAQHPQQWTDWQAGLAPVPAVHVLSNGVATEVDRAGAVRDLATAVDSLGEFDWVIVMAGDNLVDEPLQSHVDAAATSSMPVVMCRDLGDDVPPGRFGEITVDADSIVTRFREKPADPESPLAATCTYVLPGSAASLFQDYLAHGDADSPGSFIGWLAGQRPVRARQLTGTYFDIGNHGTLAAARHAYGHQASRRFTKPEGRRRDSRFQPWWRRTRPGSSSC